MTYFPAGIDFRGILFYLRKIRFRKCCRESFALLPALLLAGCNSNPDIDSPQGANPQRGAMIAKLNSLVIKRLEFKDEPLRRAVEHLTNESRAADPEYRGIKILVEILDPNNEPRIHIVLENVSLLGAIQKLAASTSSFYRIEDNRVVITTGHRDKVLHDARWFLISRKELEQLLRTDVGVNASASSKADLKRLFEPFGIEFPPGADISYNEKREELLVVHCMDDLNRIENILQAIRKKN